MEAIPNDHPLRRLFAGLVENAFCAKVGMCNPSLTGYLVDLMIEFTHIDRWDVIRHAEGKRLEQIAAMLAVLAENRPADQTQRDQTLYRHIGDYSLFWAGVYPEQLRRSSPKPADVLLDYVSRGKRSYAIASELGGEDDAPPASLLRHLSEDFEFCLYGLNLVRCEWERQGSRWPDRGGELLY